MYIIASSPLRLPKRCLCNFFNRSTEEVDAVDIPIEVLLPSHADNSRLLSRMSVLVGRIVVEHIPHFQEFYSSFSTDHVQHKFSAESAKKSNIVRN